MLGATCARARAAAYQLSSLQDVTDPLHSLACPCRAGVARSSARAPTAEDVGETLGTFDRQYEGGRGHSTHEYELTVEPLDADMRDDKLIINL